MVLEFIEYYNNGSIAERCLDPAIGNRRDSACPEMWLDDYERNIGIRLAMQ
jgi:hypothetical protein